MAREPIAERIRFDSSAEAVFQNFRRYAATEHDPRIDIPKMPIYDFGRLLNIGAPGFIGEDRYGSISASYRGLADQVGVRLPHPTCAFLNRYVVEEVEYFYLGIGTDDSTDTVTTWYQWAQRDGWDRIITLAFRGRENFERRVHYSTTNRDPEHLRLLLGSITATLFGNLYLIYERGGAVLTNERPPARTRGQTGRMRVHPLAPSSVISIRVNDPRLLRPSEPTQPPVSEPPTQPTEPQEPVQRRPARGTTVHYQHPRYVNMQGKIGHRRAQRGHPDADQPPPTYRAEDD